MTGSTSAHLLVVGIGHLPAGVTGDDGFDALELQVHRLEAPETSATQRGDALRRCAVLHIKPPRLDTYNAHSSMAEAVPAYSIEGGVPLRGTVPISGAKNAVLKLMAAAVLCDEPCTIANAPRIADVEYILEVLRDLGADADWTGDHELRIHAQRLNWDFIPLEAAQRLRASFVLLGPMLGRRHRVIIPNPGGDRIGRRPVNVHTDALGALGAQIVYKWGYYYASAPSGLHGTELHWPRPASRAPKTCSWPPSWPTGERRSTTPRPSPRSTI